MVRKRQTLPWWQRYARPLLAGIAAIGVVVTSYLTVLKFTDNPAACPVAGCSQVLASPYATLFGLPLSLYGLVAYLSMGALAIAPLLVPGETQKELRQKIEAYTWTLLAIGGSAMAAFSAYLMYILAFKIQAACPYCIASAAFSTSLFVVTLIGREWEDFGQFLFLSVITATVTLTAALTVFGNVEAIAQGPVDSPVVTRPVGTPPSDRGWPIQRSSGRDELALARHLKAQGAQVFEAYTCPACHMQKELFGREAFAEIPQVECNPNGHNAQPQQCQAAGVRVTPTWVIQSQKYEGVRTLNELADLTHYQGRREFRYQLPTR
ncbi:MAG: vitamin K epoxide reductase family protein [Pseudanabaenaceae cyanobacterium]